MNNFTDKLSYLAFVYFFLHEALFANLREAFNTPLYYFSEIILFIVIFVNDKTIRKVVFSKPSILWFILVIYHLVNCWYHKVPLEQGLTSMTGSLITKYLLLCITTRIIIVNDEKAIKYIIAGFFLYMILSLNVVQINEDFGNRLRGEFMHPNKLSQCIGFGLFFLAYAKYRFNLSYVKVGLFSLFPLAVILGCGSRNGFILFLFFVSSVYIANYLKDGVQIEKIIRILIGLGVLCVVYYLTFQNTNVGVRLLSTMDQEKSMVFTTGTFLDMFGDRGIYYYLSYLNIKENPLTGIGLYNFMYYNNFPVTIHSEYLIHFCEGGIIGGVIYVLFLKQLYKGVVNNFKIYKNPESIIIVLSFVAYLFVCFSARGLYYEHFYSILGLCMAKSLNVKYAD